MIYNKVKPLTLAVAVAASALSGQAMAGAFQLNEQGVSGQGTSNAGRASTVNDASIVFGNPAGMSFLDRAQITAGAAFLTVDTDIKNADGSATGSNEGDMVPNSVIPFGFYVQPINDNLHFGLGVYAPFGLITDYEGQFQGRFFGDRSKVEVVTVQPTISVKFSEQFSAGFGLTYNQIDGELTANTQGGPVGLFDAATGAPLGGNGIAGEGDVDIEGDDNAWGYTLGAMYKPWEHTTFGFAYHSEVEYDLEGKARFTNVRGAQAGPFPGTIAAGTRTQAADAALSITLPAVWDFSATHQINDRWTVMAGAAMTNWSEFDELRVENDVREIVEAQNYEDSWQYSVGTTYQLNPQWVLRTGLAYDETPIKDEYRSVRVPSDDRIIFSLGAGWTPMPDLTVDVAYSYIHESDAELSQEEENRGTYEADFENTAQAFGAQVTYRF
ncbi:OmpP1/FadL family transporter [Halomonas sp. DP5Y7-2]|uniref:OmpP1/FadL family transporter n=1 Tax=Halomonas sp. DP5Y7-2 TaxID=2859076 RepID=UPI001C9A0F58|nr:TonB-dependent receptor [Halomonas sp. DP5Y7-2]MBY5985521.1 OmpP1/FadL family transporter [Halomonas sp. DP5Y7-2]